MDDPDLFNYQGAGGIRIQMIWWLGYLGYVTGTTLYYGAINIATLFHPKARLMINGRKRIFQTITERINKDQRKKIWFHCASLGEFEQARPVLEKLKHDKPDYAFVVTFFSPSGYEVRKNYSQADYIFYLPFDTAGNARRFISLIQPECAFFVKYEFWYFYLSRLKKANIKTILISANFRSDQAFFRWYGAFFKSMLESFTRIFTQNANSLKLLQQIGIQQVENAGDTRYDRVHEHAMQAKELPVIEQFKQGQFLVVAGSSYTYEEELLFKLVSQLANIKIIIAPHEVNPKRIHEIAERFKEYAIIKYSEARAMDVSQSQVMIIDNVGLLSSIYKYGEVALVGGGFGNKGLHNILEPAAYGMTVLFGPRNGDKFPESKEMIEAGAGFIAGSADEFINLISKLRDDVYFHQIVSEKAQSFVDQRIGATEKILSYVNTLI